FPPGRSPPTFSGSSPATSGALPAARSFHSPDLLGSSRSLPQISSAANVQRSRGLLPIQHPFAHRTTRPLTAAFPQSTSTTAHANRPEAPLPHRAPVSRRGSPLPPRVHLRLSLSPSHISPHVLDPLSRPSQAPRLPHPSIGLANTLALRPLPRSPPARAAT